MLSNTSVSSTRGASLNASTQVREVVLHLRHIQSAVVVAIAALRRQSCDADEDIASLLQRSVADRIQDQIDRLEITARPLSSAVRAPKRAT